MTEMSSDKLLNVQRRRQSRRVVGEFRTEFERDYGRVVFSTPVRRLQDKAQVFPLETHDAIRTRLTHSIEVSSVARNMAEEAARWMSEQGYIDKRKDTCHWDHSRDVWIDS